MYKSLKKNSFTDNFFYLICLFLTLGIYLGYSSFILCLFFIVFRLITTNKETAGIFLILFGGLLGGATRMVYPSIPIYGLVVIFLGVLLLWNKIAPFLKRNRRAIGFLTIVFLLFFVAYLYGPKSSYSNRKIIEIVYKGLVLLFAYSVFNSSSKTSNVAISQALALTVIAYLMIGISELGYSRPVSFIDYEWFRVNSLLSRNQEISGINYQFTGMNSLLAFVFLLSQSSTKSKHFNLFKILFYVTCFQLILTSGARQAIFGLIAVISLYTFYFSGTGGGLKKSGSIVLGLLIVFFIVKYIKDLDISFLTKSLNPDGGNYISATGREPIYFTSFRIISENLFFGVGLGGFAEYGISLYPHNIILEILTESGLVGMFILLIVVLYFFNTSKLSIKHQTNNGTYFFLILACLFIRAFFSSDLTESIGLFSGVFALAYNRRYLQRKYN